MFVRRIFRLGRLSFSLILVGVIEKCKVEEGYDWIYILEGCWGGLDDGWGVSGWGEFTFLFRWEMMNLVVEVRMERRVRVERYLGGGIKRELGAIVWVEGRGRGSGEGLFLGVLGVWVVTVRREEGRVMVVGERRWWVLFGVCGIGGIFGSFCGRGLGSTDLGCYNLGEGVLKFRGLCSGLFMFLSEYYFYR